MKQTDAGSAAPLLSETVPVADGPPPLVLALNFVEGKGILSCRGVSWSVLGVQQLELEVPHLHFPFDLSEGVDVFKQRRTLLRRISLNLSEEAIASLRLRPVAPLNQLAVAIKDGYLEFTGRVVDGDKWGNFVLRAALLLTSRYELDIVFYQSHLYGDSVVSVFELYRLLQQTLDLSFFGAQRLGSWNFRPVQLFFREVLPRQGWKVPDVSKAALLQVAVGGGQISLSAGPGTEVLNPPKKQHQPPLAASRTLEGMCSCAPAEAALAQGELLNAYELFRQVVEVNGLGSAWARQRMLQIGAAMPEMRDEVRAIAGRLLAESPTDVNAMLALASLAQQRSDNAQATNLYKRVIDLMKNRGQTADLAAAELACARNAMHVDRSFAQELYERVSARDETLREAHKALFILRQEHNNWGGAAEAGVRLLQDIDDPFEQSRLHYEIGQIFRQHIGDLHQAGMHFENALQIIPDYDAALQGLAEMYADRGESTRAVSYLVRLVEQAEKIEDWPKIAQLNWLLGELWEQALGDEHAATARYQRVLEILPNHLGARINMARIAERSGDLARAQKLYEEVVQLEERRLKGGSQQTLARAYRRLAHVLQLQRISTPQALVYLARAFDLEPSRAIESLDDLCVLVTGDQLYQFLESQPPIVAMSLASALENIVDDPHSVLACLRIEDRYIQAEDRGSFLGRLFQTQKRLGEFAAAEQTARQWLTLSGTSPEAAIFLAQRADARHEWQTALQGYLVALETVGTSWPAGIVPPFKRALTLAQDLAPTRVKDLWKAYIATLSENEKAVLPPSLADDLRATGQWRPLITLQQMRLAQAKPAEAIRLHRDLAEIFRYALNLPEAAVPHYEHIVLHHPNDKQSGLALFELYHELGRYHAAGALHVAMIQMSSKINDAIAHARAAARYFRDGEQNEGMARDVLKTLLLRSDHETARDAIRALLRDFDALDELGDVIEEVGEVDIEVDTSELPETIKIAELEKELSADPGNLQIMRALADVCALQPVSYARALGLYEELVRVNPLAAENLRLLARLSGQLNETDKAYGYYAALLVLAPSDEEARRFVQACRQMRSTLPQRALKDEDRDNGLIHPAQSGAAEDLLTPLARFAEMLFASDLAKRQKAAMEPLVFTETVAHSVMSALMAVGAHHFDFNLWHGGKYCCEIELGNEAAVVLGDELFSSASPAQLAFLISRKAELYRTGHILCDRLTAEDLAGVLAGLVLAVQSDAVPYGAKPESLRYAKVIQSAMTPQIRMAVRPKVAAYVRESKMTDLHCWREAALCTAGRIALLVSCDIEEALAALTLQRHIGPLDAADISATAEYWDLFTFATSQTYFQLRRQLGLGCNSATVQNETDGV